jgi:hypothetical protein
MVSGLKCVQNYCHSWEYKLEILAGWPDEARAALLHVEALASVQALEDGVAEVLHARVSAPELDTFLPVL